MNDPTSSSTSIQVMSRMFSLLEALAQSSQSAPLKHISAQTGLHPSTAHRILNDLALGGFVERAGPGSYKLGLRLLALGNLVKARLDLKEESTKPMLELHRAVGKTVALYARDANDCIPLAQTSQERHGIVLQHMTGQRHMVTESIVGRAMLSHDTPLHIQHLCQKQGIRPETVTLELQQLDQVGFIAGQDPDARQPCIAAPVFNDAGMVVGALCISGQGSEQLGQELRQTVRQISAQMGWKLPPMPDL